MSHTRNPLAYLAAALIVWRERRERRQAARRFQELLDTQCRQYDQAHRPRSRP